VTEVPGGLRVCAWYGGETSPRLYLAPARVVTAMPAVICAAYEGVSPEPGEMPDPFIRLTLMLEDPELRGLSFAAVARIATRLAGHLASADEDWPSEVALVSAQPVISTRAGFLITAPDWDVAVSWLESAVVLPA
jgi:hypothetical protein